MSKPVGTSVATRLRGKPVSGTAPTTGQVLVYNGTLWAPADPSTAAGAWSSSVFADATVDAVEDGHSITIPAGTLSRDGDWLEVFGIADMGAGFNGSVNLYFGATILSNKSYPGSSGVFEYYGRIVRTGAATQRAWGRHYASGHNNDAATYSTPAETLSGAIVLKTRCTTYNSGSAVYKFMTVRMGRGP